MDHIRYHVMISAVLGCALWLGCLGAGDGRVCDPGRQVACGCVGGLQGAQLCNDEGSGWSECDCHCELATDPLRIVQAVLLETPGCRASSGPLPLAAENTKLSHGLWDIAYGNRFQLCVEIENSTSNAVEVTSQEVSYDWGEDLGYDLGPGSVPWELGVTDTNRKLLSLTVEPAHRWVECLELVPPVVGERVADAVFWQIPLDPDPDLGRRYAPEFSAALKLHGNVVNGADLETDPYLFRVSVERGWLASVPEPARCCDPLPAEPCVLGQDVEHDCRIQRDVYDGVFGMDGDTRCCPAYPGGC